MWSWNIHVFIESGSLLNCDIHESFVAQFYKYDRDLNRISRSALIAHISHVSHLISNWNWDLISREHLSLTFSQILKIRLSVSSMRTQGHILRTKMDTCCILNNPLQTRKDIRNSNSLNFANSSLKSKMLHIVNISRPYTLKYIFIKTGMILFAFFI